MKNLCTILFLFVALASRATDVSFDFKNLAGGADYFRLSTSTNRLKITPLDGAIISEPSIMAVDPTYYLPSTNGTGTMSNLYAGRYLASIRVKEKETSFQFIVTNSASTIPLWSLASVPTNSNPALGSSYSISTQNAMFVAKNGTPTNGQVLSYNAVNGGFYPSNSAAGGVQTNAFPTTAATVKSGSTLSFVAGGNNNRLSGANAVIVGGSGNTNGTDAGFIGGGLRNTNIASSTMGSVIVGGYDNLNMSWIGFIGGGQLNRIDPCEMASIVGGANNHIISGQTSIIGGGQDNQIGGEWCAIFGGETNEVNVGVDWASIVGGQRNKIGEADGLEGGTKSFIGGGETNVIHNDWSVIVGGYRNFIGDGADYGAILGGRDNKISTGTNIAIVGSGLTNTLDNSVDIGGSQATKATISLTGSVFRTALTAPFVTSAASVTGTNFVATGVTASRAAAFNSLKELVSATATLSELNFLSGVTAGVQQQFVDGTNNVSGLRTAFVTVSNNFLSVSNAHVATSNQVTTLTAAVNAASNANVIVSNDVRNLKTLQQNFLPGTGIGLVTNNSTNVTISATNVAYTLTLLAPVSLNPADATTYYFGSDMIAVTSNYTNASVEIPKSGVIKRWSMRTRISGTAGSSEAVQHFLRLNDTTDFGQLDQVYTLASTNSAVAVNQAVTVGDMLAVKIVAPTWVTNPTAVRWYVIVYIE